MSNRYDLIGYCSYRDNETGKISDNFVGVLNEQDQKIKDLEHRLSNCIEPKFKIGQEVWFIYDLFVNGYNIKNNPFARITCGKVSLVETVKNEYSSQITYTIGFLEDGDDEFTTDTCGENFVFATEEEAKARLEELKNE